MQWTVRYLPLVFAVCFIGILLGLRGVSFRRRYGYSPFRLPRRGDASAAALLARLLFVCLVAVMLLAAAAAISPELLDRFDPLYRARGPARLVAGTVLMAIGFVLVWRAQHDMAEAWRVGVDRAERTRLVTRGLFQFCRNPIYLGLQVGLCGFLCVALTYATLTLLVVAAVLFQVQARLEEEYLMSQHGEAYADYCRRVGRFLRWTGRLDRHQP